MGTLPPVAIAPDRIDPGTRCGRVALRVANLENQIKFYEQLIGLRVHWRDGQRAGLGAGGPDLLHLTTLPGGKRYRRATGMYHFAILFPNRKELGRAIARVFAYKWPNSPTDHVYTKTTYLDDPEGNNIELYCESPEDADATRDANGDVTLRWADGRASDGREALDLKALFAHLDKTDSIAPPVPPDVRIGHVHLYVSRLPETRRFYHEVLGMDDMGIAGSFRMGMVSAGGYHHHVGYNTWLGEGIGPAPADALGIDYFTLHVPSAAELARIDALLVTKGIAVERHDDALWLRDPAQIQVRIAVGA
jgi:catechol 2,3-dioxygenase